MFFAEASGFELAVGIAAIVGVVFSILLSSIALMKKQEVAVDQPVQITITEELHKAFAGKEAFEKHIAENKEDHEKIFSKVGGVERGALSNTDQKVETVRRDLQAVSQKVAGIESGMTYQNQQLASMDGKISKLLERK